MSAKKHKPTNVEMRLINLFMQIEDEDVREIIADVVKIERQYRSSSRKNFPIREVRSVIDRVARLAEQQQSS